MDRRQALEKVGYILGSSGVGAAAFLSPGFAFAREGTGDSDQLALLNEIGETIWPETDTPGAKQANVGAFMQIFMKDCYGPDDRKVFLDGLEDIEKRSKQKYNKAFMQCTAVQRTELLSMLDQEQKVYYTKKKTEDPPHYFRMLKELTLTGYYTSEIGATRFLKYNPAPGRYDGCTTERPW